MKAPGPELAKLGAVENAVPELVPEAAPAVGIVGPVTEVDDLVSGLTDAVLKLPSSCAVEKPVKAAVVALG